DRRAAENAVEAVIEGRIDAVLAELGVNARVPLPASVMPPVNVELAAPPRVLVVSPRDEIRRERVVLLRPDLTLADAEGIEATTEAEDASRSALVVGSGGVATYPAVVVNSGSYAATVETAAHEWVHHYLAFYPLGIRYFTSDDLRTVNETVADIVGEEVAARVIERWGDPTVDASAEPTPTATPSGMPAVDRDAVLRDLRLEVDALLAAGRVEDAEARMEAVRLELWEEGVRIRRINQAYFAWFGTYAARPDATDPIGAQLRAVRSGSASLPDFLGRVRGVGSRGDVATNRRADPARHAALFARDADPAITDVRAAGLLEGLEASGRRGSGARRCVHPVDHRALPVVVNHAAAGQLPVSFLTTTSRSALTSP
ncbi:MAG: hypothetical protein CVU47_10060, partial [Chloroflexi bacterium HGW-Chloroflexi-9]